MKKIIMVLAVIALVAPAYAAVTMTFSADSAVGNVVTVGFTNPSGKVRAFGLEVAVSKGVITDVNELDVGYWVHPGSIVISGNQVTNQGKACVSGSGTNQIIIEMASLYAASDPQHPTPPGQTQNLFKSKVIGITRPNYCYVTVTQNAIHGGVVMEDGSTPGITGGTYRLNMYNNTCWNDVNCPGQYLGDATCDGSINILDLNKLKLSMFKNKGQVGYNCCANFNRTNSVNILDLNQLKQKMFTSGYTGTLQQSCPP